MLQYFWDFAILLAILWNSAILVAILWYFAILTMLLWFFAVLIKNILTRSNTCSSTIFQYYRQFNFLISVISINVIYNIYFIINYCLSSFSFLLFPLLPFIYMRENFLFYSSIVHVKLIVVKFPKVHYYFSKK